MSVRNVVWDVGGEAEEATQTEDGPKNGTELLQCGSLSLILFTGRKRHFHAVIHPSPEQTPKRDQATSASEERTFPCWS